MGPGGLYVFVLLGLLMVASEKNKRDVTRCWTKGREVTLGPHECPAEFDGADAKFCCRLCYGANCCQPRRPRANLDRCPPESWMAQAYQDYTAARDLTTAAPPKTLESRMAQVYQDDSAAPDPTTVAPHRRELNWYEILFICLSLIMIIIVIPCCWYYCRRFWKSCWPIFEDDIVGETQPSVNVQSSRVLPLHSLRSDIVSGHRTQPYYVLKDDPPPYHLVVSQGTQDLPPPYPGPPVVAFQRSRSQGQDDTVVILPGRAARPQEAASASAPGAVLPKEAETGSATEETGLPEAAAYGSASKTVDLKDSGAAESTA